MNHRQQRHIGLQELRAFFTEPEALSKWSEEVTAIQCELEDSAPNIPDFLFTDESRSREFPYVTASWIGSTYKRVTEGDCLFTRKGRKTALVLPVPVMIDLMEQYLLTAHADQEREGVMNKLESHRALLEEEPNALVTL